MSRRKTRKKILDLLHRNENRGRRTGRLRCDLRRVTEGGSCDRLSSFSTNLIYTRKGTLVKVIYLHAEMQIEQEAKLVCDDHCK